MLTEGERRDARIALAVARLRRDAETEREVRQLLENDRAERWGSEPDLILLPAPVREPRPVPKGSHLRSVRADFPPSPEPTYRLYEYDTRQDYDEDASNFLYWYGATA